MHFFTYTKMDWFSWLSRTNLDPFLVYEYSQAFSHNKLEQDDISYFNHEILQSLGISIAKYRLEILKLATKQKPPHPMTKISITIKRRFSMYLKKLTCREEYAGPTLVSRSCYSERWTNKKLMVDRRKITSARISSFSKPIVQENDCWAYGGEEIKWDTMFHNLKPT
ncbi:hypothetical protein CASFOL_038706 [Castilleja foliolosa]|uniref:SAM domain-containing protein n=1 Tax=Castilleja foliolosa TaxID=1961234 RepID=A0ABD3BNW3_9LAMI